MTSSTRVESLRSNPSHRPAAQRIAAGLTVLAAIVAVTVYLLVRGGGDHQARVVAPPASVTNSAAANGVNCVELHRVRAC
jgi:hypothetical protein